MCVCVCVCVCVKRTEWLDCVMSFSLLHKRLLATTTQLVQCLGTAVCGKPYNLIYDLSYRYVCRCLGNMEPTKACTPDYSSQLAHCQFFWY